MLPVSEQLKVLSRNVAEVVPAPELEARLGAGRPLRVKFGVDPTAEHVTLGWAVPLRKLRQFQDLGHVAVLIVGDFTARIGDPSGRDETRPMLSKEEVDAHTDRVLEQFGKILSAENLEVRRNSEWLEPLGVSGLLDVANHYTVARMLERNDFAERYASGSAISMREFIYPLLQGYDSIAVRADVELGGTDQHFNLVVARHLQRAYDQEPQVVMTMPLLEGTDGVRKMSQSLGNYVAITEAPEDMFGKLMRVPDELMGKYLRLTTALEEDEIDELEAGSQPPQVLKRRLASEVVKLYHGESAAEQAAQRFDRLFVDHLPPEEMPELEVPDGDTVYLPRFLADAGVVASGAEARRLIAQGGVHVDGEAVASEEMAAAELRGRVLRLGKRRFYGLT